MESSSSILDAYDLGLDGHRSFTTRLELLLKELLAAEKISPHSVLSRVKTRESIRRKLSRPGKKYGKVGDVTDVCGVRVITYLKNDIARVAALIEKEFKVDLKRSVDRRTYSHPDRFGYASLHFVISLRADRLRLKEYAAFRGCVAEIQIRSIIMHAWAEIEHDLGYKSEISVPNDYRRRFSRLAALLEIADDEFQSLSKDFEEYRAALEKKFKTDLATGPINGDSLHAFVRTDKVVVALEKEIVRAANSNLINSLGPINDVAASLSFLGVDTFEKLSDALLSHRDRIRKWAAHWIADDTGSSDIVQGISLFYLCYCIAASSGGLEKVQEYCEFAGIGDPTDGKDSLVPYSVMEAYEKHA